MIREKVNFDGWQNCIKMAGEQMELIITTDVGPRIISLRLADGQNLLYMSPADKGKAGGDQWRIYGGHRLWHAPEVMPRTYCPDNTTVKYSYSGNTLLLLQDREQTTGIRKEMEISLDPSDGRVTIRHRLVNENLWEIMTAPWAITAMAGGGRAILPQEPFVDPALELLPSRPVVLWHYTQMSDPRWKWGNRYIQLFHDKELKSEQKIGILNKQGWAAYYLKGELLVKKFGYNEGSVYTDFGCNNEVYVNGDFLEVETLGPFTKLVPGGILEHTEEWIVKRLSGFLTDAEEISIDSLIFPVVESFLKDNLQ